eukprot:gene23339-biopygen2025
MSRGGEAVDGVRVEW